MDSSTLKVLPAVTGKLGWPWQVQTEVVSHSTAHLPKISIITPSYNQGQYLEGTIRSIIAQDYFNYELIIIDADSTDNTLEVIRQYEPWITYWVSEPDRGQSHAIQKGLAVATGDIINWINSDDLVAPGAFRHIAAEFDTEKYDAFCGYCHYFIGDIEHLEKRNERMVLGATVGHTLMAGLINQPSTFFAGKVLKELGVNEEFHYAMDLELWYRFLLLNGHSRIQLSEHLLTYFRLHGESKSVAESERFRGDIYKVFYNILYSFEQPEPLLAYMRQFIPAVESFQPSRYEHRIPEAGVAVFIRNFAWFAVAYHNDANDFVAARQCLAVALRYGQALNGTTIRQLLKLYLVPLRVLRWLGSRT